MKKVIKTLIIPTLKEANIGLQRIVRVHNEEGNPMTKKQLSECISSVIESKMVDVCIRMGITIEAPKVDSQADIILEYKPLEIKTTSGREWRGGEYSKRESDYLLVSYDYADGEFSWFVIHKYLEEKDWKSSKNKNYYATSLTLNEVVDGKILVGDIEKKISLYHPKKVQV